MWRSPGRFKPAIWLAAALVAVPYSAWAHPEILDRLEALDQEIAAAPDSALLYLKRGELFRRHGEVDRARDDFEHARSLDPKLIAVDYHMGRLWLDVGEPLRARAHLDRYLAARPLDPDAFLVRARAATRLGDASQAVEDLSRVIALTQQPTADLFVERARTQMSQGPKGLEAAARGVAEGLVRLGPLVSLVDLAVEIDVARGAPLAALDHLRLLPDKLKAHPKWLARRADLLLQAGRKDEAVVGYEQAMAAIQTLPNSRRSSRAMLALKVRLNEVLDDDGL